MFNELELNIIKLFNKRNKRGLINGLGSILKSITGNLDSSDEERYNSILEQLSNNQKILQTEAKEVVHQQQTLTEKFNKNTQTINLNENKLRKSLNEVMDAIKKEQSWKTLIHAEVLINKILIYIQRLKTTVDNIIKSLEFCSLNQLDVTIIEPDSLLNITQIPNILQIIETIHVTCTLHNNKIHVLLVSSEQHKQFIQNSTIHTYTIL